MTLEMTAASDDASSAKRPAVQAVLRGAACRCPACGEGKLYKGYLKVVHACDRCGEELHHQRADDAPPYIVISVVGHVVVGALLSVEMAYAPPTWVHLAIWLPLAIVMSLVMLPPVKGALVGLQWAHRMHGFGGEDSHFSDGGLRPAPNP